LIEKTHTRQAWIQHSTGRTCSRSHTIGHTPQGRSRECVAAPGWLIYVADAYVDFSDWFPTVAIADMGCCDWLNRRSLIHFFPFVDDFD
jgi:hypothetical protein